MISFGLQFPNSSVNRKWGLEKGASHQEHLPLLQRTQIPFPAPTWWSITILNFTFRDSMPSSGLRGQQTCIQVNILT